MKNYRAIFLLSNLPHFDFTANNSEEAADKAMKHFKPHRNRKHLVRVVEVVDGVPGKINNWRPEEYKTNQKERVNSWD